MHLITCFFNPENYATKRDNFYRFTEELNKQDIQWLCIEAIYGSEEPLHGSANQIIKVKAKDVLWQKERMLNLANKRLPKSCDKVVWSDCDLLFENPDWFVETDELLDMNMIVQPFETAIRLPHGHQKYYGDGDTYRSFASVLMDDPTALLRNNFEKHGHTGFVWAARREVLNRHGLYEGCIAGGGDHMMAHAFAGDFESPCVHRYIHGSKDYIKHFQNWCEKMYEDVRCKISFTSGRVLHLWHGDMSNRRYAIRNNELCDLKFNPLKDIRIGKTGLLEWTEKGKRIDRWARDYFKHRQEDGVRPQYIRS